ncbi:alkanesulfonate monooxygenase SsuD/methylene tetrahydromethanopterin reductase-like flavin-dependent oxidoreductase (luciferase family) [Rhodococcus sp. LBL1]|nr:alkanesulfonate monooxygenase SsuD/methylene tetrahydromethanopterin reductase-like flavin-dependent oxidoreductase (luciferase family) [Rhodococcus sp. LBL1]MDH6682243.1 alkanesulfonate monooxygenase SsuD/methylene tetrahydromethanopterin reductase-like flavin-dependent oxidoreductase (luciferase family) [Rhodococcus sp. LBL2]
MSQSVFASVHTSAPRRPLRVAVELTGAGHHPAAARVAGNVPLTGPDYWVDLTVGPDTLDLAAQPPVVHRIRAVDLREAQQTRSRIRGQVAAEGRDPDTVAVLVDVETLISADSRSARTELALLDETLGVPHQPSSLSYIGTAQGLASLVADIHAADVADGVTLLPLALPKVLGHVVDGTLPWLERRGLVTVSETVDEALARFGLVRHARAS